MGMTAGASSEAGDESQEWVSDEDLKALERNTFGSGPGAETSMATAQRLFEENAIDAAMTIIRTAKTGSTDRIRFDAAKYVIERSMGPVPSAASKASSVPITEDALLSFAKTITSVAE